MPLKRYYGGKGAKVKRDMDKRYGKKQGDRAFYATVNKMRKGSSAERKAQPKKPPGSRPRSKRK